MDDFKIQHNARLRGWQRITTKLNHNNRNPAAHWDWKRHALTVPLEAFVISVVILTIFYLNPRRTRI
ncbi:hypothetical protein EEJ35_17060 [Vibrio cholerae]|nr:hypothetical protein EEJ35_17060 [Vibrio cholerae]